MNIGILGTGFGAYHAALLNKLDGVGRITVFGRNEDKLNKLKEEFGVEITQSAADIMNDPSIGVVDICLPSNLHSEYAVMALKAGKDVFCETPVGLTLEDAKKMADAEKASGRRVLVNQFIKFEPAYQYLYNAAKQETYGKLLKLTLKRESAPLWGDLGLEMITPTFMIHELDFITWLLDYPEISDVWGTTGVNAEQSLVSASFYKQDISAGVLVSSLMPDTYPFTVEYEAYFERAKLKFHECDDMKGGVDTALYEYTASGRKRIELTAQNPYEKSLQYALTCFQNGSESILALPHAARSLQMALSLRRQLIK
ncbi:dehydrogenase [Paenibacillus sp. PK3_47]|uniref:Gfo/Idh/MocA family protein n=1 Tax=Paenibacillus sp. PK3_47 TaxID=2072642 RepID=UPI00201E621A|nr:Gfo/Idh/MocA family oxidoreductase [Paenibacillus sp. PK3_47]UQZ37095.1 dehydrogenase [Paenibacillus sp. PK3_47]